MAVDFRVLEDIAVLELSSPPVNTLTLPVRVELLNGIFRALDSAAIRALIISAKGKAFCAGADLDELMSGAAMREPRLSTILDILESASKPVIAAVHGIAVGGGLELAMACHIRIFQAGTLVGMPETNLGLIPGAGGTQRLPRLVGLETAANMILTGDVQPIEALNGTELCSQLVSGDLMEHAATSAMSIVGSELVRSSSLPLNYPHWEAYLQAHRDRLAAGSVAATKALDALRAGFQSSFEQACATEQRLFSELLHWEGSRALRHVFTAEKLASKVEGVAAEVKARQIARVAVIGAGTMGSGIAMSFLDHDIPVTLVDVTEPALQRGTRAIHGAYENAVKKGRVTEAEVKRRLDGLTTSLKMESIVQEDLVIEAVFEDMALKEALFKRVDSLAKRGAILASNTSSLDLNHLAGQTQRRHDVIGLHFFAPANVMSLLEVVRTDATSDEVLASALALARRIGKTPVVARVCDGFIGNRMIEEYGRQAGFLLEEGCLPAQVDAAIEGFGFSMGPFRMYDMVGNDIPWRVRQRRREADASSIYSPLLDIVYERGRLGQKTRAGWYDYLPGSRKGKPSAEIDQLIVEFSAQRGIERRTIPDTEIVDRLVLALVNEGARLLEEGIAQRASDIDVVFVQGYGFPRVKGGPLFYAESRLPFVLHRMSQFACSRYGRYWQPAPLLKRLVAEGRSFFN